MNTKKRNDVTITIPGGLLESLYHTSSRLEGVQDLLLWLIRLLEGQGVDVYPHDDFDALPEPPDDYMTAPAECEDFSRYTRAAPAECENYPGQKDAPGTYLIYNGVPSECKGCPTYVEPVKTGVTCTGYSSVCDDCPNYSPMPDVCKTCPTFAKRLWAQAFIKIAKKQQQDAIKILLPCRHNRRRGINENRRSKKYEV